MEPKCQVCGAVPEFELVKQILLNYPKIAPDLNNWMNTKVEFRQSKQAKAFTTRLLINGLQEKVMTSNLKEGAPVPRNTYEDKTLGNWFEGPLGQLSITADYLESEDWRRWWESKDVDHYYFCGRNQSSIHLASALLGTNEQYTLPKVISQTE